DLTAASAAWTVSKLTVAACDPGWASPSPPPGSRPSPPSTTAFSLAQFIPPTCSTAAATLLVPPRHGVPRGQREHPRDEPWLPLPNLGQAEPCLCSHPPGYGHAWLVFIEMSSSCQDGQECPPMVAAWREGGWGHGSRSIQACEGDSQRSGPGGVDTGPRR